MGRKNARPPRDGRIPVHVERPYVCLLSFLSRALPYTRAHANANTGTTSRTFRRPSRTNSQSSRAISSSSRGICSARAGGSSSFSPPSRTSTRSSTCTRCSARAWSSSRTRCRTSAHGGAGCASRIRAGNSRSRTDGGRIQLITIRKTTAEKFPPPTVDPAHAVTENVDADVHTPAHKDFREKYFQGFKKGDVSAGSEDTK